MVISIENRFDKYHKPDNRNVSLKHQQVRMHKETQLHFSSFPRRINVYDFTQKTELCALVDTGTGYFKEGGNSICHPQQCLLHK